mgnify:CR=1 FL=1
MCIRDRCVCVGGFARRRDCSGVIARWLCPRDTRDRLAVADRHGFSLVIDKGNEGTLNIVLYNRKGLDITNEVVKEFNKRFP